MNFQVAEFGYMWINYFLPTLETHSGCEFFEPCVPVVVLALQAWTIQLGIKA